jgi:thioredoxin reductase (NADPH)
VRAVDLVVVGAGPAGVAAAVQAARLGVVPEILDRTGHAGGLVEAGFLIENYPGLDEPLPGPAFAARLGAHLRRFGLAVAREAVTRVEPRGERWLVRSDGGERLAAAVILCAGTRPRAWSVPGAERVAALVFDDVRPLLGGPVGARRVLVAGGGEAAFDYALSLARAGIEATILVRGDAPRAGGRLLSLAAAEPRIRVETATRIAALEPAADGVAVVLETPRGTERRTADAVLTAVGRESALGDLLPGPFQSAPGLFVCGDARLGSLGQAGIAVGDGLAAAPMAVDRTREVTG